MPLMLSARDLATLLDMPEVIQAVEEGFREHGRGRAVVPLRQNISLDRGIYLLMPSALPAKGIAGTKQVSVFPTNAERGLPTIFAIYALADAATGETVAIMDAGYLTGIRTAAASAVAAKYLARPEAEALGIVGTGVQARFHLWAMKAVLPVRRVFVLGRRPEAAAAFSREMAARHGIAVEPVASAKELAARCDLLVTASTSPGPVVFGKDLRPGMHLTAVGAFTPTTRELDGEAVRRAAVVVDTYEGAWAEAGDLLIPLGQGLIGRDHVRAELAEVVLGRKPGRPAPESITFFKSVGFAIEDLVTAELAFTRARQQGLGTAMAL